MSSQLQSLSTLLQIAQKAASELNVKLVITNTIGPSPPLDNYGEWQEEKMTIVILDTLSPLGRGYVALHELCHAKLSPDPALHEAWQQICQESDKASWPEIHEDLIHNASETACNLLGFDYYYTWAFSQSRRYTPIEQLSDLVANTADQLGLSVALLCNPSLKLDQETNLDLG